jgi:bifunctional non-homologous end joining protein LigD
MSRTSTLPKRLQPMLATLTNGPFDDAGWVFEDKYDGFRMVAKIDGGRVTLYSRNGEAMLATQAVPSQARLQPSSG